MKTKNAKKPVFQNRIVGHGTKAAKEFVFNPGNWRIHPVSQKAAINEVLDKIGWVTGVLENVSTGRLVDGHLRITETLERDPDEPVPFTKVELTEDEERQILLILDPIGALAETDGEKFIALADSLSNNLTAIDSMREAIEMPDIDLSEFFASVEDTEFTPVGKIVLQYEAEEARAVREALASVADTPEKAVKLLLKL